MITFSQLGKYGRFGNQLFQIAALHSFAEKNQTNWIIPEWSYADLFEREFPSHKGELPVSFVVKEPAYKCYPGFLSGQEPQDLDTPTVDILGYFQHTEYWTSEKEIKELFKLRSALVEEVRRKYSYLFERDTIMVGVRRTDYVGKLNGKYHQLSPSYYLNALQKFKYERFNIVFISDDLAWCKFHFGSLPNTFFPEFESDKEQFIAGTLGTNWIIANSTFHWWSAFLGTPERVIQPTKLFAGPLLEKEGDVNFYKKDWEFQEDEPVDLTDVTFTIPVRYDHSDRKENVDLAITLLNKAFKTNIIICENGGDRFQYTDKWCDYFKYDHPDFHRTRMLNLMTKRANTPIVVNFDADVAFPPAQLFQAVRLIRQNKADVVYPYEYLFSRIPRPFRSKVFPSYDIAVFKNMRRGVDTPETPSHGGAVVFSKDKFFEGGGENENFISYGPEDRERFERFTKLGYRVARTKGDLWHFDHFVGINSSTKNPHYNQGKQEYQKILAMDKAQLKEYIGTWEWAKQYDSQYYTEISPTATQSARKVLKTLHQFDVFKPTRTAVLDMGCGIGEWGVAALELGGYYTGIDYGVKEGDKLTGSQFDWDLRSPLPPDLLKIKKYDLILCLEVGEHIEKRYAPVLVKNIVDYANEYILFGAAIPGQGGRHHVNEQWQDWWAKLFGEHGWYPDEIQPRELLRDDNEIDIWYRNNMILYSKNKKQFDPVLRYVHPTLYENILKHHKIL